MPLAWRIVKTKYKAQAFTGAGAAFYGGRWNSKGHALIYTSEDVAVALLETLVHLPRPRLMRNHSVASVTIPPDLVQTVARLPRSWKRNRPATQRIGDGWVRSQATPVLAVPSAMFESARIRPMNYLLNPNHPAFEQLEVGGFSGLELDPRIV